MGKPTGPRHGHYRNKKATPTYRCWTNMVARCHTPSATYYEHYTKRGITVCDRWRRFANFLADMGEKPDGLTLDRIDNDGNYEPGNCRWVTMQIQANNRTSNRHFVYEGKRYTLAELARHTGVPWTRIRRRLVECELPWTVEGAIKTPPLPNGKAKFYC